MARMDAKVPKPRLCKKSLIRKRLQGEHFQLGKGSKVGRKESTEEAGPPWKGLCSGQLLTAQVKIDVLHQADHLTGLSRLSLYEPI